MNTTRIKLGTKIGFGAGEFSSSIFFTLTSFWLMNFLTDEVRLSAALAGTALLVGKIWDAVIDPFIGYFSDRTKSRWGRRRPYLLFFAVPFGAAFVLMFTNPMLATDTAKFLWAMLAYIFFCTVYSFTNIPYNSLLPEMTADYHERTSISGFKQAFAVIGTLLGAGAAMPIMGLFAGRTAGFTGMAAIFGFLAALTLLITFLTVREPALREGLDKTGSVFKALKEVFINKSYVILLSAWFLNTTAVAIMQAMLIYYYKYVFKNESAVTLAMISLLVVAMLTIPLWVWLAKKLDKKFAYLIGMTLTLAAVVVFAFAADKLGEISALVVMAFAGVGFASHYVVPWAMAPDTIEYGYAQSKVRREGVYYSIWTFVVALGGALAGFLVGQGLTLFEYVPDVVQSLRSITGIRLLIGVLPAIFILAANVLLLYYPLNRKRYAETLEQIKQMEAAGKGAA